MRPLGSRVSVNNIRKKGTKIIKILRNLGVIESFIVVVCLGYTLAVSPWFLLVPVGAIYLDWHTVEEGTKS